MESAIRKFIRNFDVIRLEEAIDEIMDDPLGTFFVPHDGYAILACEFHRHTERKTVTFAQYAIYQEIPDNGKPLMNSMNIKADYKLVYVCDEEYMSTAVAIAEAVKMIQTNF